MTHKHPRDQETPGGITKRHTSCPDNANCHYAIFIISPAFSGYDKERPFFVVPFTYPDGYTFGYGFAGTVQVPYSLLADVVTYREHPVFTNLEYQKFWEDRLWKMKFGRNGQVLIALLCEFFCGEIESSGITLVPVSAIQKEYEIAIETAQSQIPEPLRQIIASYASFLSHV